MANKIKPINKKFEIDGFFTAFRFEWNDRFVFNGERHSAWEIVYIDSGNVEVTEDEKIYTLEHGNMILHAPMEFHRIRSANGTSPSGLIMSFTASGSLPETLKKGIFVIDREQSKQYEDIVKKVMVFLGESVEPFTGQEAAAMLSAFLINLSGKADSTERLSNMQSAMEYRKLISEMTVKICDNCSLEEFAHACNISISYLKFAVQDLCRYSPQAILRQSAHTICLGATQTRCFLGRDCRQNEFFLRKLLLRFFQKKYGAFPIGISKKFLKGSKSSNSAKRKRADQDGRPQKSPRGKQR